MKKLFKQGGLVNKAMWHLYDLLILNLLWVLCSIPLVTIGASTTALFFVSGRMIRGEEVRPVNDFFRSFKENFKQSTLVWIILVGAYSVVLVDIYFFSGYDVSWASIITVLQFPILAVLIIMTIFIFPILSRFDTPIGQLFKISFILGVRYFLRCLVCIGFIVIAGLLVMVVPALALFFLVSGLSLSIYGILNRVLEIYSPRDSVEVI